MRMVYLMKAVELIAACCANGALARRNYFAGNAESLCAAASQIAISFANGGKLLVAAENQLAICARCIAAGFAGYGEKGTPPLPALALVSDFPCDAFMSQSRQLRALGANSDALLLLAFSEDGNADIGNMLNTAKEMGIYTIYFTSSHNAGNPADIYMAVSAATPAVALDFYLGLGDLLPRLCEHYLYDKVGAIAPFINSPQKG